MKKYLYATTSALVLLAACSASANTLNYSEYEQLFGEPVTTGATGTPMRSSEVPLDMDIITQEDIKRAAARDIPDLLRQVRGVNVRRNGNGWADVSIRGYNQPMSSRLLVLLDGRQVYQEDYGYVNWQLIPVQLSEIKQIEVVRGPNTALYGFNATSGVINIITNNPLYDDAGAASVSYGASNYKKASVTTTKKVTDNAGVSVSLGGLDQQDNGTGRRGGLLGTTRINDDIENYAGRADTLLQLTDKTQLGFSVSDSRSDEPAFVYGSGTYNTRMQDQSVKGLLSSETEYGLVSLQAYHTLSQKTIDGLINNQSDVVLDDIKLSNAFKLGTDHSFRVEGGYRSVTADVFPVRAAGDELQYDIASVGGLWSWKLSDEFTFSNALRYDRFMMERTGPIITGSSTLDQYDRAIGDYSVNSGLVYTPSQLDTFRLTYARGVDLPSLAELSLRFPQGGTLTGNPYLDIGVNHNFSFGYERKIPEYDLTAKTTVFYQKNNDLITATSPLSSVARFRPYIDSEVIGGELGLDGNFATDWRWGLSYSYAEVNDQTSTAGLTHRYDGSESNHMVTGNLGYSYGQWTADSYLSYYSSFNTQNAAPVRVDGQVQLDAHIGYQITDNLAAGFTLIGATEPTWDETGGRVMEPERQAFATLTYNF